jgi:hypothetical protein
MFCPHCGAPQLRYEPSEDAVNGNPETAGSGPGEIRWKQAIVAAITFAVPVGLLSSSVIPILSAGCCLWVLGGAIAAVALYQRRSASTMLSRHVGSRIGLIIGILAATVAAGFNAASMLFERYVMHGGEAMEKAYQTSMEQGSALTAQISSFSPAQAQEALHFWLSPDGRAAVTLLAALMTSIGITVFSMIGGSLGARIFSGRNPSLRNT